MTEIEWLKQESGMNDEDLARFESFMSDGKFKQMLTKLVDAQGKSKTAVETAEQERLNFEQRYSNEYLPEMRRVTEDAIKAKGEAAAMRAQLDTAREYGIVVTPEAEPVRAPGSPTPGAPATGNYVSRDDLSGIERQAFGGLATMNDLNAQHYKLFGAPVDDMTGLMAEVTRQRTLGHQTDIRSVWESKYNVAAKRAELAAADQKKHDDAIKAEAIKEYAAKHGTGANPNQRSGQPSRFSTYDKSGGDKTKPWQTERGMKSASNAPWRREAVAKIAAVAGGR